MKKLLVAIISAVAVLVIMTICPSPVMAGTNSYIKCYTITTGNTKVYNSNSTSSGKRGTIFGSDELKLIGSYSNGFLEVQYPSSRGTKTGFILKSDVVISTSGTTKYASRNITTYRRNNTKNTYGSIYQNDAVMVLGTRGGFTQVRYPISGGFKFAWIRNSDANNYLKNSKTVNPTSVSLKVKLSHGSMFSNGTGFQLNGFSSSAQMKAVVYPANATNTNVTWSSADKNIVKITSSGYITPVSNGTTKITARTANGKTASVSVKVVGTSFDEYYVSAIYEAASPYYNADGYKAVLYLYKEFNHKAQYDVKHKNRWMEVFDGYPFPEKGQTVVLFGRRMTAEDVGNAFYGTVGAAIGVSDRTLYQGGGYAKSGTKYLSRPPYYGDDANDHEAIYYGIHLVSGRTQRIDIDLRILDKKGVKELRKAASLLGI